MKDNKFYYHGKLKDKPLVDRTKVMVEIEIPTSWLKSDKKYDEIRKKITLRWALIEYLTGMRAEDWVGKNDKGTYKNDGAVGFIDAASAVEEAILELIDRVIKGVEKHGK